MSITVDYLNYHKKYAKKYGEDRTIVLMQVGSFHESYATETEGPNLRYLSSLLNVVVTKKSKAIPETSIKNPLMMGFPSVALEKFLNLLIDNNFTVIIIDQVTPPPKPKREVTGIYSPGTHINRTFKDESNFMVSIFIQEENQLSYSDKLLGIGLAAIDLSIGDCHVYQSYSKYDDKFFALDEALRFINHYNPTEVLVGINGGLENINMREEIIKNFTYPDLLKYLNIDNKIVHALTNLQLKDKEKIVFQNTFLGKIYNGNQMLTPIEYLELERMDYSRISFITLLEYAYNHNKEIIKNIKKPHIFDDKKFLHLGNNAIAQLDVISNNNKSMFDIINKTSTPLGKRFLKSVLSSPLINSSQLKERYNHINILLQNELFIKFEDDLKNIIDLERLHRRISLKLLHPYEFYNLITAYNSCLKILKLLKKNKIYPNQDFYENYSLLNNLIEKYSQIFDVEEMSKYTLTDVKESFFKPGICHEIDEIQTKLDKRKNFMNDLVDELSKYIDDKNYFNKSNKSRVIRIEYSEKDGHYIMLTKRRLELLKKGMKNVEELNIGETKVLKKDLDFKPFPKSSNVKIYTPHLDTCSEKIILYQEKIKGLVIEKYTETMDSLFNDNKELLEDIVQIISYTDFIKAGAKVAKLYNYCQPVIDNQKGKSYLQAKNIRHPIVERINLENEYITNDISLGCTFNKEEVNGILLYGLNSAGKSTLMKAIGLNIILAQIGFFVPCSNFIFYPYHSLFTRISGNDNMFKGMSSYMVEMIELRAILKRNNSNSLIICDEICKGTEVKSANIIVTAMVETLSKSGASFITATHLHQLMEFKRIQEISNVKAYHLHVEYDRENNLLIFDRVLKQGSGKSYYGLDVAQYVMDDMDFIKKTREIEIELNQGSDTIMPTKKSKYNSKLYIDECMICSTKENLEVHHIEWQKDCNSDGFILSKPHVKKNHKSNLMPVCQKCHDDIDRDNIKVTGYEQTSNGPLLKWEYVKADKKKNSKKYNQVEIDLILGFKTIQNITQEKARKILLNNHKIKISKNTIRKIWKNEYVI
ncbi:MutS domain V [seawater metagenome]|uniref:MutS domain V n=1 Tax=seawater metagenome TaxID=1561972 RepID=A0A5E8CIX4_9ZZZZ